MSSFLDKVLDEKTGRMVDRGMYNPLKRYGFKNITDTPFHFHWNDPEKKNPIIVKPGVEIELPEHLAITATHKLVDEIMGKLAQEDTERLRKETRDHTARSPLGSAMGVPAARKIWEDKILREISIDEQSPQAQVLRAQLRDGIMADISNSQKPPEPIESVIGGIAQMGNPTAPKEFAEIGKK